MAAIGYGEFHPAALNDTEENRRKNRRVVFFVKNTPYPDQITAAPGSAPPALQPAVLTPTPATDENSPAQEGREITPSEEIAPEPQDSRPEGEGQ